MPITVKCACGRSLKAGDQMAGKKARCPSCNTVLTLPPPLPPVEEPMEVELAEVPEEEEGQEDRPRRRKRDERDDDDDDRPRLTSGRKRKKSYRHTPLFDKSKPMYEEGTWGTTNAGIIGGGLMILLAVIWLVVGLSFGRLFIYPFIMMVIGLIAIVKSLLG